MRLLVLFLVTLSWQQTAQAFFFCINVDGHGRSDNRVSGWAWRPPPPPPQLVHYYAPGAYPQLTEETENPLPPIRRTKKSPEIIQGFRFRPLGESSPSVPLQTPADWRD